MMRHMSRESGSTRRAYQRAPLWVMASLLILAGLIVPLIGADDASAQIPGQSLNAQVIASDDSNSLQPQIAADSSNNLHAVWYDTTAGRNSFKYSKGTWNGTSYTWATPNSIFGGDPESTFIHPQIAIDRLDRVHVVWSWDRVIYYRRWPAEGGLAQATPPLVIGGNGEYPSIAVDSRNRAHVVWEANNPDYDILYRMSDGDTNFTTAVDIAQNDDDSLEPDIAVDHNDVVHVVWYDKSPGAPRIQYTRKTGDSWSTPINISEPWAYFPEISADRQGCIHIVWATSADNNLRAIYRRNCNGNWEPGRELGSSSPLHTTVSATANGKVLVTWTSNQRLNYSFFDGANWTPTRVLTNTAAGPQLRPDSTRLPNGNLAVVWQERRPGGGGEQYDPMFGLFDLCNAGIAAVGDIEQFDAASGHHRLYLPVVFNQKPRC
jgi:hypothetical protein